MKIKSPHLLALGTTILVSSLWLGAFLCQQFPPAGSYGFAAFSTGLLVFVGGCITIAASLDLE